MPQMSFLMWFWLYVYFFFLFILMIIMIYFIKVNYNVIDIKLLKNKLMFNLLW